MAYGGSSAVLVALLALAACTGGDASTSSTSPDSSSTSSTESTSTTTGLDQASADGDDLLTFARGALLVSQTGIDGNDRTLPLQAIDGDPAQVVFSEDPNLPVELVYRLPSPTSFNAFAVANAVVPDGRETFFGMVTVSGSDVGPDGPFTVLGQIDLSEGDIRDDGMAVFPAASGNQAVWVKVRLEAAAADAGGTGRSRIVFSEIIGVGVQEEQPLSTGFEGVWDLRFSARPDSPGETLELVQDGAVITGCLEKTVIQGSVNGSIAKATGLDPGTGETSSYIFVVDNDGSLAGAVAVGNRSFVARTAVPLSQTVSDRCGTGSGASGVCDAPLYVNFEYDSAVIESESEQLLSDIYRILVDLQIAEIIIEGHTSSEGSEAHNLELSKARAQAVADDLIRRGFPAGAINVVGLGESDLLVAPDNDESARSINRRVEIVCGQAGG